MKANNSIILQRERLHDAFQVPRTMLEAARIAKVERANVCWYVHDCREEGTIYEMKKGCCPVTGARARFYTTNPNGWQHFVTITSPFWQGLPDDDKLKAWEAIRAYYLAHYDNNQVNPAPAILEAWENNMKPLIDSEVQLWKRQ